MSSNHINKMFVDIANDRHIPTMDDLKHVFNNPYLELSIKEGIDLVKYYHNLNEISARIHSSMPKKSSFFKNNNKKKFKSKKKNHVEIKNHMRYNIQDIPEKVINNYHIHDHQLTVNYHILDKLLQVLAVVHIKVNIY